MLPRLAVNMREAQQNDALASSLRVLAHVDMNPASVLAR